MTSQDQSQLRPLCPHLAAAVLWMSKPSKAVRSAQNKVRYARAFGESMDHLLAL